jgi:hypothetical protein
MQLVTRSDALAGMEVPPANRNLCKEPLEQLKLGGTPEDEVFMHEKEETNN